MTLSLSDIKTLNSVDLENYEIRGAKPGVNNARTTGPLYVSGTYEPDRNDLSGDASFVSDSSIVNNISFDPPYSSYDASIFKAGDYFFIDSTQFSVLSLKNSTSIEISANSGIDGINLFSTRLGTRDYLIEPDKFNNTFYGDATFTKDSTDVYGIGTSWLTDLTSNDFIKRDNYQVYYRISSVSTNTHLKLVSNFAGSTEVGPYTAKKQRIGQMYVRYTKDDFSYQKNGAFWEVDETTGSHILTSTSFSSLADGIELKFSPAVNPNNTDLMDTATIQKKVLVKSTDRESFQFSLPVVPNPETTLELYINDILKDRFPYGNQDYVVNYSADPIYVPPPLPEERKVANILFLNGISNIDLNPADTETGAFNVIDSQGNQVSGIMPGSETIKVDGTAQTPYQDYVIDSDSGTIYTTESHTNEHLVSSVGVNISKIIDYGIKTTLDGQDLIYTIPPSNEDEVRIVLNTGRVVPAEKDHPGSGEEYLVEYQVESNQVSEEPITVIEGMTSFRLSKYPLKDDSVILTKNDVILDENVDYRVSYQTGRITMFESLKLGDSVNATYIPLSIQQNGITYENGKNYCNVYDSRLNIQDVDKFLFGLINPTLDATSISLFEIFNQTRAAYYDIAGAEYANNTIKLQANTTNVTIGLGKNDRVTADYKFEHDGLEYAPVVVNNFSILEDSTNLYLINKDATSYFPTGGLIQLTPSDAARNYYFTIVSASFDGEDTIVQFTGAAPEDIINPSIYVTDSSVSFDIISAQASNITKGISQVTFPGVNIPNIFRLGCVLQIADDAYTVNEATFEDGNTIVTLQADIANDYTSASVLSSIRISRTPLYIEGTTTLIPSNLIVTDPAQPAMSLTTSSGTYSLSSDTSKLTISSDSSDYNFYYNAYPTISSLSSGIVSFIPSINITDYVSDWTSSHIVESNNVAILEDSTAIISIEPSLRLDGSDMTNYQIENGLVVLDSGLEAGQRYDFDYQGQSYLGDSTINISARYFTTLPALSKISASLEYDNLDQFYIQIMSQRYFLENVIEPRQEEEANQNSGSVGQGGNIPGDEDEGNAEGGLVDNEFRRKDAEIECRVYDQIYDFFSDRAKAFGDELYASTGLKLLNNDGLLDETDQSMGTMTFNRMFPADYTNLEPYPVAALTGQTEGPGNAIFINGSKDVTSQSGETLWSKQLKVGDYIRPKDETTDYQISAIKSDSSVVLVDFFDGTSSPAEGETFVLTAGLPLFDDDGFMGAKVIGSKSSNFGLVSGDTFDATVEGNVVSCTFIDSLVPFYNGSQVAQEVNFQIPEITMSYENVYDPNTTFGTKTVLVIRTDSTNNCITLGDGTVTSKLGFVPGEFSCGNLNPSDNNGENYWDSTEASLLDLERPLLDYIIADGTSFKLDRTDSISLDKAWEIYDLVSQELADMSQQQEKLNAQISALSVILQEPSLPSYAQSLVAYNDATQYRQDTSDAMAYAGSILYDWQNRGDNTNWVLDYTSTRQYIRYKDSVTNIGYDATGSGLIPIQGEDLFVLEVPASGDRRILNLSPNIPDIRYELDDSTVNGTWIGWSSGPPVYNRYSINNDMTFNADSTFSGSLYVDYQTLSDELLSDRTDFLTARSSQIITRIGFIDGTREDEIRQHIIDEELFRASDGAYGNLYIWADNRFNRSGGCEAKLKQAEKLMGLAQSNLAINRRFL